VCITGIEISTWMIVSKDNSTGIALKATEKITFGSTIFAATPPNETLNQPIKALDWLMKPVKKLN